MKLMPLVVSMKTLVLVACLLCVKVQSRGLRYGEDQNEESEFTDVVNEQHLVVANQVDRKLVHERCRRLHEHEGPDKVRELCYTHPDKSWWPNYEFGRCYEDYGSPSLVPFTQQEACCYHYFPKQTPEQRKECNRDRPYGSTGTTTIHPAVGWYTDRGWRFPKRCIYYDGSGCGYQCRDHSWYDSFSITYSTKELCCNDNYPANYALSGEKTCTDLVGLISNGEYSEPSPRQKSWLPNWEFNRCYEGYESNPERMISTQYSCCLNYFAYQTPEQRKECLRYRPFGDSSAPAVGWYTHRGWVFPKRCFYYDGSGCGVYCKYDILTHRWNDNFTITYSTKEQCCNDNYPTNHVLANGKTCTDLEGLISKGVYSEPTTAAPTSKPTIKPTIKPSPKPTSKPTKWSYRCMSGAARVGIQSINEATLNNLTLFKNVRNLAVGDTIRGLDKSLNPTDCLVQAIGHYGSGTVYGNYTNDHSILDPLTNTVTATGNSGVSSEVDVYSVLTSCPVGIDESGIGFTPFSTVLFGAEAVSWSDYILIHRAIVDIVKVVGPFVFYPETYTSTEEVGEYTNAFYKALLICNRNPKSCDAFEMAALELVEMSMTDEARAKVQTAFPDLGKLNMPGSIAASVTNGASVIYSWVPDWMGLNKGCVSAPLGSIETYTPKYEEQSVCCSFHYSWDVATCMSASTNLLPPFGWYPAWTSGIDECLDDSKQPEYMSKNPTQYLFPTRQACCDMHYSWSLYTCLGGSGSTDTGDAQWYMDWTGQAGGDCVMNCPQENVDCGGLAKSWDTLWTSKEECCKKMKWWDASCETN